MSIWNSSRVCSAESMLNAFSLFKFIGVRWEVRGWWGLKILETTYFVSMYIQGGDYVPVRQTEAVLRLFLRLWPKNFTFIEILCLSSRKTHFCLFFPPQAPYHSLKHHVSTNLSCTQQFWVSSAAWRLQLRLFHEKILVQYPLRP